MTASVKMSLVLTRELSLHNLLEIVISTIYKKVHQNCWESLEIIKEVGTNEIVSSKINCSRFNKSVFANYIL